MRMYVCCVCMFCICIYVMCICRVFVHMLYIHAYVYMYIYIVRSCGCMHFMRMSYVLDMDKYPSLGSASLDMSDRDGVFFLIQNMNNG